MQEYPKVLYHVVHEPIIVKNKEEVEEHCAAGWSPSPQEFNEVNALQAKIAWHNTEASRLQGKLDGLLRREKDAQAVSEAGPKEEKFICDVCGYEAKSKAGLSAHKRSHNEG